jgi:hypothetical protein
MDNTMFTRLIADLHQDPALFHAFVFEPKTAVKKLKYLDAATQAMLQVVDPRSFVADAAGLLDHKLSADFRRVGLGNACGPDTTCSCTSSTCGGVTCGGSTCDVTCTDSSCGNTCGDSCGFTTNFEIFGATRLGARNVLAQGATQYWDDAYVVWE